MAAKKDPQVKESSDEQVKTKATRQKQTRKKIDKEADYPCKSLVHGNLTYISKKTGMEVTWSEFGDEEWIEFSELQTMKSSQPRFLKEPWLFIDDPDVAEFLGLKQVYDNIISVEEIENFFKLTPKKAKEILKKAPRGIKDTIADKSRKGIEDGSLNNIQIIRVIQEELQIDLISLME